MATRDLHDQKTLKALQGIESQLKEFNKNFAKVEVDNKKHTLAVRYHDCIIMKTLDTFTNSDGTVIPLIPSKNINYYIKYTDVVGVNRSTIITGAKLLNDEALRNLTTDIFFCCKPYEMENAEL